MTVKNFRVPPSLLLLTMAVATSGQTASELHDVQSVAVGSLGPYQGAEDLRDELRNIIRHSHRLKLALSPSAADAVIEGHGELWVRARHALSPRSRTNSRSAEPVYDGYLSVKLQGNNNETLWSYLTNPGHISFDNLRHELAAQVVSKLNDEIAHSSSSPHTAAMNTVVGEPAILRGGGATFPAPVYADWFAAFRAKYPQWQVTYESLGSAAGVDRLSSGTLDFAGSDIPPPPQFQAFPTVGGAVVLIYNLPDLHSPLKLSPDAIAGLFDGTIKTWDDGRVAKKKDLPASEVVSVHRADGSGTTYKFTEYLANNDSRWKQEFGTGQSIRWPGGHPAMGNVGVAEFVGKTRNSVGYVEFIYALQHHLTFALVQNATGRYMEADLPSIMAATNGTSRNAKAPDAYPISGFSWILFPNNLDSAKRTAMLRLLEWMLTSGQRQCSALGYAPLPPPMAESALASLRRLR